MTTHKLDLGAGDVHVPSATSAKKRTMISAAKRKSLPKGEFALPAQRKYPIDTAARVRNAAARLEQEKKSGNVNAADYAKARAAIGRAAKRLGIESEYNKPARSGRGLRMTFDHPVHGRFEIRHMKDGTRTLRASFPIACDSAGPADSNEPVWVQIAIAGHFEGHRAGPFDLDAKVFSDIIRNYREVDNGEVAFDFEHASEAAATDGTIPTEGAPAQAWIKDLAMRDDGNLYALVGWLEPARTYIREGKYRHVSPAIRFGARDPKTNKPIGARLTSVALTNTPFLRGMDPLRAKDTMTEEQSVAARDASKTFAYSSHEYMPRLKAAMKLHELATPQELADHLDRLREHVTAAGGNPDATMHGVRLADYMHPLREIACGGAMGHTVEGVLDIVEQMIAQAIEEHEENFHGVPEAAESEQTLEDTDGTEMADKEIATALKDTQDKVTALSSKLKDAETQTATLTAANAELSLSLKDAQGRAEKLDAELKTLRDESDKRKSADQAARVEEAFETYKDKKSLTAADKDAMLIVLCASAEKFEAIYPKVRPSEQHLMRDLTTQVRPPPPDTGAVATFAMSTPELVKKLMAEKKLSFADAQNEAYKMRQSMSA